MLTFVDPLTGSQRSEKRLQERLKSPTTPATSLPALRCMAHYAPFFHSDPRMAKKYDKSLVQSLAVFQALYFAAYALNALLGRPFVVDSVGRLYCGTFVYNLVNSLSKRTEAVNHPSYLPDDESLIFVDTYSLFESKLQCLKSTLLSGGNVKKNKKSNRTKNKAEPKMVTSVDVSASEESDYCDFENKFAALAVQ